MGVEGQDWRCRESSYQVVMIIERQTLGVGLETGEGSGERFRLRFRAPYLIECQVGA